MSFVRTKVLGATSDRSGKCIHDYPLVTFARDGEVLIAARDACTWRRRLRGLQGNPPLAPDEALLIRPCRSVQTWHMSYPIDVVFLDRRGRVRKLARLVPGKTATCLRSASVIEMAAGAIERLGLKAGDLLTFASEEAS